jgi:hypothetical protein
LALRAVPCIITDCLSELRLYVCRCASEWTTNPKALGRFSFPPASIMHLAISHKENFHSGRLSKTYEPPSFWLQIVSGRRLFPLLSPPRRSEAGAGGNSDLSADRQDLSADRQDTRTLPVVMCMTNIPPRALPECDPPLSGRTGGKGKPPAGETVSICIIVFSHLIENCITVSYTCPQAGEGRKMTVLEAVRQNR